MSRHINYDKKLQDVKSDMLLIGNSFIDLSADTIYTSWEILQKEKTFIRFKRGFQKLLTELNNRPYDSKASELINELTKNIVKLSQEREVLRFCSVGDVLSDSKEVSFVCNGSEWYEEPMIDIFKYMSKYGYPYHGNCQGYITSLCKSIRNVPLENKEEWENLIDNEADYEGGIVVKKYQNAMIGIFDQIRILLVNPNYERKARVIYKLHRQYQFSPTYLSRTLLPIFNINIPITEIMELSSFEELKVNGDPEWLKSLAVL